MASEVIGEVMDLHLSGVDLKFPHNDNELAQSTAYWSKKGEGSHGLSELPSYLMHGRIQLSGAMSFSPAPLLERVSWKILSLKPST